MQIDYGNSGRILWVMILKYLSPCIDQKGVTELNTCTLFKNKFGYLFSLAVQNAQPVPPVS